MQGQIEERTLEDCPIRLLSSIGDVTDKGTWSGTPFALWQALAALQRVETHDVSITWRQTRLVGELNRLIGLTRHNPARVGFGTAWLRHRAQLTIDRYPDSVWLHFGSGHLPVRRTSNERHFLFTDSTTFFETANPIYKNLANPLHCRRAVNNEAQMIASLDGVLTTAEYVAEAFRNRYDLPRHRVTAVGSGLGHILPKPQGKDYSKAKLLFVAKQNFVNKGGAILLDAFDMIRRKRPDASLTLIGNAKDGTQLPYLSRMQNTPGVHFFDWNTPHFKTLLAESTLYVGPAPDEPWGIIYLEALSVQTPIVGLAANAFPEFALDGKLGFIARSPRPADVADAVLEALSDAARLSHMGQAARSHVLDRYNWSRVAQRTLHALLEGPTS